MVVELTEPIQQDGLFIKHNQLYGKDDLELPLFLRRFTAGSVYISLLNKRIEALQCLKKYREAVDLLQMLIDQDVYLLTHRGHWYDRIALNLETHLKDHKKVIMLIYIFLFIFHIQIINYFYELHLKSNTDFFNRG